MKTAKIIFWSTTGFLFYFEALMPLGTLLFTPESITAGTKSLGYPDYFSYLLMTCKKAGATALMLPI